MNRFFQLIRRTYKGLLVALNYVSVILIFLMSLLVFADVMGRYLFNHPIAGTTEIVKCTIIAIVFLGIAYTLNQKRHIRTTILLDRMPPIFRLILELIASLLCLSVFSILIVFAWQAAWEAFLVREFDGVQLKVPVYPSRFIIVLGSGLLIIQSLSDILTHSRKILSHYRRER